MATRSFIVAVAVLCTCSAHVSARLWETQAQLEKRCGKPSSVNKDPNGDIYTYHVEQYEVLVTFLDRRSQSELYVRRDSRPLTPQDIQKILSMNAAGNTWRKSEGI